MRAELDAIKEAHQRELQVQDDLHVHVIRAVGLLSNFSADPAIALWWEDCKTIQKVHVHQAPRKDYHPRKTSDAPSSSGSQAKSETTSDEASHPESPEVLAACQPILVNLDRVTRCPPDLPNISWLGKRSERKKPHLIHTIYTYNPPEVVAESQLGDVQNVHVTLARPLALLVCYCVLQP